MEPNEAKNLLKLMGSRDVQVLEKVLVTVSNLATFTPNQVIFIIMSILLLYSLLVLKINYRTVIIKSLHTVHIIIMY